jgi:translation initiation factor IF-1
MRKPTIIGTVTETLPDARFTVELEDKRIAKMCYLSGKMRQNRITVLLGDKVEIDLEGLPPDLKNGRITRRK